MKSKSIAKSIARRRRRSRLRKLKQAALTVGLATAWGSAADGAQFNVTATTTITLQDSAFVIDDRGLADTSSLTITAAALNGPPTGDQSVSQIYENDFIFNANGESGYYYIGISEGDLVVSFPNGGSAALGQSWSSLFMRNGQGICEEDILDQLAISPLVDGADLDPTSPLGIFNELYGEVVRTPFGSEAELIAFTNNAAGPNHGISGGQTTVSVVPEPTTLAIIYAAGGMTWLGTRRRD